MRVFGCRRLTERSARSSFGRFPDPLARSWFEEYVSLPIEAGGALEAKLILTITAVLAFALAGCAAKPPNPERFVAAIEVTASAKSFALSWLSLVDESKDAEAFAQTSELYRQTTSESSFLANLKSDAGNTCQPYSDRIGVLSAREEPSRWPVRCVSISDGVRTRGSRIRRDRGGIP